ncbi:GNAT family N-acetyltransferase [Paenibacillus macquariensis]|uniref:Acetyltransferase (GNAT) family protein n=1 Tax=Paenibacillus macquariensis TaxID=948756 RepID=A0ABY1JVN9_9BACL|nr:GNAT family N-acetyltransferase [Paenibacillus macquariensis]MEC0090765.1 GNAT family N-acetyltransferase [Paenibacillus macquariensis]OAB34508.1 acetyltransferase [Paenibacillus macquariensis subsp. macquariensis]SIQ84367.1 Acetyltransferase (GNAT) family protein [Paenibacillus macquariensis]
MTTVPITLEPMQTKYNLQVGHLLVHGFRGKFQHLTNMNDDDLAVFFENLFEHFPTEPASQRMVALQDGEVIGTISIKWKPESDKKQKQEFPSWKSFNRLGKWNLLKMLIGLSLLDHKPQAGECYIADIVVHPDHRSKGIGKLLFQWAQHFVQTEPHLDVLSLHVVGSNPRAKHLYELLSFQTHLQKNSLVRHLFFKESKWDYMVLNLK